MSAAAFFKREYEQGRLILSNGRMLLLVEPAREGQMINGSIPLSVHNKKPKSHPAALEAMG